LSQKAGQYTLSFQLFDVLRAEQVVGYSFNAKAASLRSLAHRISDMIYQALTGESGAFDSRIAYIAVTGSLKNKTYQLKVSDLDGYNPKTLVRSEEPLLSPAWSPDGKRLAYVSLENKRTAVYVQNVSTGQRDQVAAWPGLNSAPAWSPDGQRLALSLSKDGNPEIYILNLSTRRLQRVTNHRAIDTEPSWSPDGQNLIFTSDRAGSAQIYKTRINGGTPKRLTYQGSYNARASFSADGEKLTLLHRNKQGYKIAVLDLLTDDLTFLSQSGMEESPSFAPNGSMVVYAAGQHLVVASADARVRQRLAIKSGGEIREPAWSPLNQ
jgi:TolB protein